MKAWHYAAVFIALVAGVAIGFALCGTRHAPPAAAVGKDEVSDAEQAVLDVLSRPVAMAIFMEAAKAKSEFRVITMRSKTEIQAGSFSITSDDPEKFSIARQEMALLQESGLIDGLRTVKDSGRETKTYILTPSGHRVAKMLMDKK